jgi:hypothetical protein
LGSQGYNNVSDRKIRRGYVVNLLATYLLSVTEGTNLKKIIGLTEATLVGYLGAAYTWLVSAIRIPVPKHVTIMGGRTKLHPLWGQTLDASRAWLQPKEKR